MSRVVSFSRQAGAVIVTVALLMLFLMGFMGIALDFSHLFVVRTELQTAMDSCALAAAQELDKQGDALVRARSAGIAAGNLNSVDFQSATWRNGGQITDADITFKNTDYNDTSDPTAATYAQCQHTQAGVRMWLLHAMGAFSGANATYPNTQNVLASAVATRANAQTSCPIPVALKPNGPPPNYGLQIGEWVTVYGDRVPNSGELGWYNLDGSSSASNTRDQLLNPNCQTRVGDELGTPGAQTAVHLAWNYRFGIYRQPFDATDRTQYPDFSGYSYTANNWTNPVPQNAWSGTPAAGSHPTAENFLAKRSRYASFADTGNDIRDGSQITFGDRRQMNSFQHLATPGAGGQHQQYGSNRRVAVVPVLGSSNEVIDYVCMFMLHPLSGPQDDAQLEFLGNASNVNSPCITNGFAGGSAGPLVPVLVR